MFLSNRWSWPIILILSGCTSDYTPEPEATGEEIYQAACSECHQSDDGVLFKLHPKNANEAYIAYKVKSGSLTMPAFKNMKAEDLHKLGEYILAHSQSD